MKSVPDPEVSAVATASPTQETLRVRAIRESDAFDHYLCRRLAGLTSLPRRHASWSGSVDRGSVDPTQTLVASVDGLLVGRAVLEAVHPPYCELVNLCVRPDYRRQGVGSALVRDAQRRARSGGFKYMAVQIGRDDDRSRSFHEKLGFLPAAEGEMRRMVALLDVPMVRLFEQAHCEAEFTSRPDEELGPGWWRLEWRHGSQYVALSMLGGSCQYDCDGLLPVVRAFSVHDDRVVLQARVDAPDTIHTGEPGTYPSPQAGRAEVRVAVRNLGEVEFVGAVRAVLQPGLEVSDVAGANVGELRVEPGGTGQAAFTVAVQPGFSRDALRFTSYPAVPLTAEVCWEEGTVLLSAAARIV